MVLLELHHSALTKNGQFSHVSVAIALGSNLGDSLSNLENACKAIAQTPGITLKSRSSWYLTIPVGPAQPNYLNGCACFMVQLPPEALLKQLLEIEQQFGRVRRERWGPRTLDLDILFYGDLVINTSHLKIPHPRLRERAFVLVPLNEIAPDWIDPLSKKTIAQLVKSIDCSGVSLFSSI